MSLSLEIEKSESRNTKHSKVEEVLQKQVTELQVKLESARKGRQAESEMAQEAMQKSSQLERAVSELNAKLKGLMDENSDLKEQLYAVLEHQTTKSCGSDNSKVCNVVKRYEIPIETCIILGAIKYVRLISGTQGLHKRLFFIWSFK